MRKIVSILAGVVVGVILLTSSTNIISKINSKNRELATLKETIVVMEQKIQEITKESDYLKEVSSLLSEEKEALQQKIELLQREYDELKAQYLKEIQPVSFSSDNLLITSNATNKKLETALVGTGLEGLAHAYMEAELTYGVNAIFLVALTAEESGWGNSYRAKTQNNLSGFAVYSPASRGTTFSSKEESIMATAKLLKEDYLNSNGQYYNGTSVSSVNIRYCPNDGGNWSNNITTIANEIVLKINSQ